MTSLKIDIDRARFPADFATRLRMLVDVHGLAVHTTCYARTTNGWHIVVVLHGRVGFHRVVLFQALLGSDWKREMFNSRRALAWRRVSAFWRERANVLYRRHYRSV
jgi:hypothetical protein